MGIKTSHGLHTKLASRVQQHFRKWSKGEKMRMHFYGVKAAPKNHYKGCYFCLINIKGVSPKVNQITQIYAAIRPVSHLAEYLVIIFDFQGSKDLHNFSTGESRAFSIYDNFMSCTTQQPQLFNQIELNDLVCGQMVGTFSQPGP